MGFKIENNEIYFTRQGEAVLLSACGENCIRFQGSPNCRIDDENHTLMPQKAKAYARIEKNHAVLQAGDMKAVIYHDGKVIYYYKGSKILEEKPELTFESQIRNYRNIASGLWKAQVTFEPNENEHFYGLGHEATGCFDLKGCTVDLRNVNAKCAIPFVYSSKGYGFHAVPKRSHQTVGDADLSVPFFCDSYAVFA